MRTDLIQDLADCTEFRQTLHARPPAIVHGTLLGLALLLGSALGWMAWTRADLVVRAPGRVRPITSPMQVVNGSSGDVLSASAGGRVVEVTFQEGDTVRQGAVLIRLDTERLDNEITKQRQLIQTGETELAGLDHLEALVLQQYGAAKAKAEAEVARAVDDIRQAKARQDTEVRLAELELHNADHEAAQLRHLVERRLGVPNDLRKALVRVDEAQEKLKKALLPVETRVVEVLRQELALVERDYAVKRKDAELKRRSKRGEVEAARIALANLELERTQAVIRAPREGIITAGDVKVGDSLERGKPVVEIAEQQGFRFEAAVPSSEVGQLRLGMLARIKLDAYDYQQYGTVAGTVVFLSPDSGIAQGQQTATYLVRLELASTEVGRGEFYGQVKLGMAGQAEIVTGHESLLRLLVKRIRQTISLG